MKNDCTLAGRGTASGNGSARSWMQSPWYLGVVSLVYPGQIMQQNRMLTWSKLCCDVFAFLSNASNIPGLRERNSFLNSSDWAVIKQSANQRAGLEEYGTYKEFGGL
jgi:hypothetical protein